MAVFYREELLHQMCKYDDLIYLTVSNGHKESLQNIEGQLYLTSLFELQNSRGNERVKSS